MREPKDIMIGDKSLEQILEEHQHWINEDCEGWRNMRANLSNANLSNADLSNANLRYANLWNANLSNADLWNADLRYANLSNANLSNADLWNADLRYANLSNANLSNADLSNANLSNANLSNAKNVPFIPYACPDFGIFIGFKKAIGCYEEQTIKVLVTLEIPEDARRLSATGRKCRCDKAKVLRITDLEEKVELTEAYSDHDNNFYYRVGEMVSVDDFDENRWNECSTGIHFFINKQEAIRY